MPKVHEASASLKMVPAIVPPTVKVALEVLFFLLESIWSYSPSVAVFVMVAPSVAGLTFTRTYSVSVPPTFRLVSRMPDSIAVQVPAAAS